MDLEDWIRSIRSQDPVTSEDAYEGERPSGPEVLARLIAGMQTAPEGYTRGKFAELLGAMGDVSVAPYLIAELAHPEPDARKWAALALEMLGVPEGVHAARQFRSAHPEAFCLEYP